MEFLVPDEDWARPFREEAERDDVPVIRRTTQQFLTWTVMAEKPERILEIGTATGFSAVVMYRAVQSYGRPDILTVENYPPRIAAATKNLAAYADGITLLPGDAADVIRQLRGPFDMIFLDGPKAQYGIYLPRLYDLLRPDGILVTDNVLQDGAVLQSRFMLPRRERTVHKRMRDFLYEIMHDDQWHSVIVPVGDGVALSRKRSKG